MNLSQVHPLVNTLFACISKKALTLCAHCEKKKSAGGTRAFRV